VTTTTTTSPRPTSPPARSRSAPPRSRSSTTTTSCRSSPTSTTPTRTTTRPSSPGAPVSQPHPHADERATYEALAREILDHDRRYYVENNPIVSDTEYDRLHRRLVDLEAAHPEWVVP